MRQEVFVAFGIRVIVHNIPVSYTHLVRIDPIYKTTKFHAGMDFSASPGTPVYATGDGVVVKAGWETGYGLSLIHI